MQHNFVPRLFALAAVVFAVSGVAGYSQDRNDLREIVVVPSAASVMAPSLFPNAAERTPDNAATILLRLAWETNDAYRSGLADAAKVLEGPLDQWSASDYYNDWRLREFHRHEMRRAAMCSQADWQYDRTDPWGNMSIPDVQLRSYVMALMAQCRGKIKSGNSLAAVADMETTLAIADHTAAAPFIIHQAIAQVYRRQVWNRCEDLMDREEAPNLYWPLTNLPTLDDKWAIALDGQVATLARVVHEPTDPERAHDRIYWTEVAQKYLSPFAEDLRKEFPNEAELKEELQKAASRSRQLLKDRLPGRAAEVDAMPIEEVGMRFVLVELIPIHARMLRLMKRPPQEAWPALQREWKYVEERKQFPEWRMPNLMSASIYGAYASRWYDRQRVAALRTIEALRHYAASHNGQFPQSLDEITDLPVPSDPISARPFEYAGGGKTATLIGASLATGATSVASPIKLRLRLRY